MTVISLLPGQNISLPGGTPLLIRFDALKPHPSYEIDSCAFALNRHGKVRSDADFVFFNQPVFCAGVLQKQSSEHEFFVNPQLLPPDVNQVVFSLSIYDGLSKKQNFSVLSACRGDVINSISGEKIAEFVLNTKEMTEIALLFFTLYLNNGQWKLRALGDGFNGGLDALAAHFGVDVSEGETKPSQPAGSEIAAEIDESDVGRNGQSSNCSSKSIHKKNPLEIAKDLHAALIGASETIPMAEIPKQKLVEISEVTKKMIAVLEHIHKSVVPLDLTSEDGVFVNNLVVWKSLQPGYVLKKHIQFQRLLKNSKTLGILHKNAIDILSVYKFSDLEINLSYKIGDFFSANYPFYQAFKALITQNQLGPACLTARVKEAVEINDFLQSLQKAGVIAPFQIQLYVFNSKEWVNTDVGKLRRIRSQENKIRFNITLIDPTTHRDLITGHWFNAFAYSIISDHLSRNQLLHEIYSRVSYQSPSEIFKSKGDFDIVALAGKTILAVECKSGNLKEALNVDQMIDKMKGLEKVFATVGSMQYQYQFLMIYNPFASIDQAILDKLSNAGVRPVMPSEIRGVIFNLFSK
ncbi:TerD family protein [Methylomicrobium sp. Wu6]|uniref:TerD family protein n=1 Tax=Methylomicrobium sp. Wu6 TaxID=3107928 RepID=UPI002DD63B01|nr:TerD family protein [Methylomicrobium sp. Wu6]MEC4747126.1 TerD family protein [Methylomicrobium sp. Wu6]